MKDKWLITNLPLDDQREYILVVNKPPVYFYTRKSTYLDKPGYGRGLIIKVDGYVMPRAAVFDQYRDLEQRNLVFQLYQKYGKDFIHYVKGIFTIVIIDGSNFYIFNDPSGVRKFFHYANGEHFVFTNRLECITNRHPLSIREEHAALFSLMEHFIDGMTLFNEVTYSTPATCVCFSDSLKIDHYWNYLDLTGKEVRNYSFTEFAGYFRDLIAGYTAYFAPKDVTMTLTGGNDSRTILSALLNISMKPRAFTFGNPDSYDGVVAREITEKTGMEYSNYFVDNPSAEWFERMGKEIIPLGHSLVNIHRAHRLDAIQKEKEQFPDTDMLFAGFMGGDYIKGIVYDDYITAKLVRLWEYTEENKRSLVKRLLKEKFFRVEKLDLDYILNRLEAQPFFNLPTKIEREFAYVFNVVGAVHDAQDTNVFNAYVRYVVNIFMDIDFLEFLFGSPYSMMNRDNSSKNQLKRLLQPALQCNMINLLAPELSDIEFAKHYSPKEFLGNKLIYAFKRMYRYYYYRKFAASFPYGEWFPPYVAQAMEDMHPFIEDLLNLQRTKRHLGNNQHQEKEGYWHRYTNIINIDRIIKCYG